ncbi:APC family permease [Saccharolobus islandicus]|uniref:Amino acid transporter n=1 Tax=Saccharolobus islandicus LAL14/1 TaxID=1241935 RepID=M9UBL4_SACIS|nr:APC family permease [Sulfolobus islandicus]AGJ63468.1 Amino acid transporter [Sulfolobus islandicus LAL14/1]
MSSKNKIFVRETSGLIKNVSLWDAVALNIGNMSAGIALFESISPYIQQGGVLWLASLIGFIFAIPQLLIYVILTSKIPRTGGDYIWISRSLNGGLGSTMALAVMIESTAYFALVAFFTSSAINTALTVIGEYQHSPALLSIANNIIVDPYAVTPTLQQSLIIYGISALVFVVIILLNIFRAKWGYRVVSVLGIFSMTTLVLAMIVLALNSGDFYSKISTLITANNLNVTIPSSRGSFLPSSISWSATLFLLPFFALYTYPWMQAGPAVAAEFKGKKTIKWNLPIALILTGILVTLAFLEMDLIGGYNFNLEAYPTFLYNFWTAAIAVASNPILQWIIALGLIVWNIYILAYGVIVFARYVFALSFDRVLPTKFSEVNKHGSPVYAHVFDLSLTLLLLLVPAFSIGAALSLYGATILGSLYFLVVSVAGIAFGIKERNYILSIAGLISAGYFAYLTYVAATNSDFGFMTSSGPNLITTVFVIGTLIVSALIYIISRIIHKRKGIDIDLAFKEIPPE